MSHRWNGYLIRALNELVSVTVACKPSETLPARASIARGYREQRREKKFSARQRRQKGNGLV